jgi:DNA-binding response OmpR family regulator
VTYQNDVRLLIVDQEPKTTLCIAAELRKINNQFIVDTANSAQEAILRIQQIEYNLVITDYHLPAIDGTSLVKKMRSINSKLRVIVMTEQANARFRREIFTRLKVEAYLEKPFNGEQLAQVVNKTLSEVEKPNPAVAKPAAKPAGSASNQHPLTKRLQHFRANTNARCVLVLSKSGHIMDMVGDTTDLDTNSISALVAANFMAGIELLGKILGNESVFNTSYYEGPNYTIYANSIDSNYLLAIIFGRESKQGVIRFYVNKLIEDLVPILRDKVSFSQNVSTDTLDIDFSQEMKSDLDKLFGAVPTQTSIL